MMYINRKCNVGNYRLKKISKNQDWTGYTDNTESEQFASIKVTIQYFDKWFKRDQKE